MSIISIKQVNDHKVLGIISAYFGRLQLQLVLSAVSKKLVWAIVSMVA